MTTTPTLPSELDGRRQPRRTNWFAAFWRWHFYGSVIVIPVLCVLAVTGMTYMFRAEVDAWTHPGVLRVEVPPEATRVPLVEQEAAVRATHPDAPVLSVVDGLADRSTVFVVGNGDGENLNVYVDPYRSRITGELTADQLISDWAERIHGDLLIGEDGIGDRIVELGASWAIVLTITGFIIFFLGRRPRRGAVRKGISGARLRGLHAIVGLPVGIGILMLVLSGLPWTGVWGSAAQSVAAGNGLSLWGEDPGAESSLGERMEDTSGTSTPAGWAIGNGPMGTSGGAGTAMITVDDATAVARSLGAPEPYSIMYPENETGVFTVTASQWSDNGNPAESDLAQEVAIHIDQYTGEAVGEYGYADYSPAAKAVSQGIAIHEGRRLGVINTIGSTLFCLAVMFMCVSAPIMWWTRRGSASGLAAPRAKLPLWGNWLLVAVMAGLGVFLPLFGLSLIVVLVLDQLLIRRLPRMRRFFGTV